MSSSSSSSSSTSSSQGGEHTLSSLEAFNKLHDGLKLKNSTFFVENYIEEKLIGDKMLVNHYYGSFAEGGDDGYFQYLDQGMYKYSKDKDGNIIVGDCQTLNKDTLMSEFFYTTYDLYSLKNKWKEAEEEFTYISTNAELGGIITELAGNGLFTEVALSYSNKLEIAPDGLSATFTSFLKTDGFGDYTSIVLVKDLGTTTDSVVEQFLKDATPLVNTNDFPSDVKASLKEMFGNDIPAPNAISYAHKSSVYTYEGVPQQVTYEDFLMGDQVESYRQALEDYGFVLSSRTDIQGDLKNYGYVNWYYDFEIGMNGFTLQMFFYPKIYLDDFEQGMYPNGIFHLRFTRV